MKVHSALTNLPAFRNAVITIGSFDGVHSGHQKILERVNQLAREIDGESVVITFHPHPRLVVYPEDTSLKLLTTVAEKTELLERYGVDHLVIVPFSRAFSEQNPEDYIQNFLYHHFHPKYIVIGYDHRFGAHRQGDIHYLRQYEVQFGYQIVEIPKQEVDDISVSSSKIRKAIESADVHAANRLLNHSYRLSGTVVKGQQIGNTIGYPTANLYIEDSYKLIPPFGIYAVKVWVGKNEYGGMLYIGDRPTLPELPEITIEVNIFDFDSNIYGQLIRLDLIGFIRNNQKFESLSALQQQLHLDKVSALEFLSKESVDPILAPPKKETPSVAVVILNFNTRQQLLDFLPFVIQSNYPNLRVVLADNGSSDGSVEAVREHFPEVEIIALPQNLGFAGGYNAALAEVDADYFVLLNSDVEVTPDWLEPVIRRMEADPTIGACQPKMLSYKERHKFEYAGAGGGWLDALGYPFCEGRVFDTVENDEGQYNQSNRIFWASGAALFIRGPLFQDSGGFDATYFAHMEEVDLCWRLKRAGFSIVYVPESCVFHVGGGTLDYVSPQKTYLNFRNNLMTLLKNESPGKLCWLFPLRLVMDGLAGVLFLLKKQYPHILAIIQAHFYIYRHWVAIRNSRKAYQILIDKIRIDKETEKSGIFAGSIVWNYYIKRKKTFREIVR